jgi:ABC-type dipeptide/oligopeptide/nickel transport system permease subunit
MNGAANTWRRLRQDRAGLAGLAIVGLFATLALLSWLGLLGSGWAPVSGQAWEGPSTQHWFGTNLLGQDVFDRAMYSTGKAFRLGISVTLLAIGLGALLGGAAGWHRGKVVDEFILWLMGVLDSIPFYLFAAALAFALGGSEWAMLLAMGATFWTGTARLIRGEVIRLREREFVLSARAIGLPGRLVLWRHILPNSLNLLLVQATLTFVAAIKTEVILSFLGMGVKHGVSWGLMLAESTQDVLTGQFANFLSASGLLFLLLLGFNLLADALQEATPGREVVP